MPAPPSFVRQVRHALAHLYDPDVLRTHPLLEPLGVSKRANPQAALRETLLQAIETLKPAPSVPISSRAWRVYKVLQCRYVQQMDQQQTALQLGVGVRHVRREQHVAVEALADALFEKFAIPLDQYLPGKETPVTDLESELAWLKENGNKESADIAETLMAILRLAAPLANTHQTALVQPILPSLPPVAIHPAAIRQALLSATSLAIRRAPKGVVTFSAEANERVVSLMITASVEVGRLTSSTDNDAASLQAANTLLQMVGGTVVVSEEVSTLRMAIKLAIAGTVNVLLIDDNADFAQLFARYVAGTRYRLRWIHGAEGLFDSVAQYQPHLIVLDVMIPGVDGWEILGRLRQHPLTSHLPIIICTIVPERELALSLGATLFLPKPVARQALLTALEQALAAAPSGSR